MEVAIKFENLPHCIFHIMSDPKEIKIFRRDQFLFQKMPSQKTRPTLPIGSLFSVDQNHRDNPRFPCLHQSEAFKSLVHCAETARKQSDGMGLFDEINFSREKIVKIHQLRIALDNLVGLLFKR